MRSFQKFSSCALLALSLLAPAVASSSPQQAKALADIEAKGLRSVGSERLESMMLSAVHPRMAGRTAESIGRRTMALSGRGAVL